MSIATNVNSYRQFNYSVKHAAGVELVRMLANENIAREMNRPDMISTEYLSNRMASYLMGRGYVREDTEKPGAYCLTEAGTLVALLQAGDPQTMESIQADQHKFVVHPDTLRLRKVPVGQEHARSA